MLTAGKHSATHGDKKSKASNSGVSCESGSGLNCIVTPGKRHQLEYLNNNQTLEPKLAIVYFTFFNEMRKLDLARVMALIKRYNSAGQGAFAAVCRLVRPWRAARSNSCKMIRNMLKEKDLSG